MNWKKRWKKMPIAKKFLVSSPLATLQLGLLAAALWDIKRRPADEIKGPKFRWVMVSLVNTFGPISYFLFGRKKKGEQDFQAAPF